MGSSEFSDDSAVSPRRFDGLRHGGVDAVREMR